MDPLNAPSVGLYPRVWFVIKITGGDKPAPSRYTECT